MYIYIYIYTYVMYACIYVCMCVCMYVYIYIYMDTHTCVYIYIYKRYWPAGVCEEARRDAWEDELSELKQKILSNIKHVIFELHFYNYP